MTAILRWEEPPPAVRGGAPQRGYQRLATWAETMLAVRHGAGRWACVYDGPDLALAQYLATQIRAAASLLDPGFEAAYRRADVRAYRTYARYVGDPS